tara:strand:+ start:89 stop:1279 length:1191 start_codon:yes stop_codon:yes gene_type:complete
MSIKVKHSPTAPVIRARQKSDVPNASMIFTGGFTLVTGSFSGTITIGDSVYDRNISPSYYFGGNIETTGFNATLESLNTSVATVTQDGVVTRVSEGVCRIMARDGISMGLTLDLTTKTDAVTVDVFVGAAVGSLAEHISAHVDDRIDNTMTMTTNGKVFTTQDHSTPSYTRNPNLWCSQGTPIDLTCISPWNSRAANKRAGTLVTPRHVLNAAHYPLYNGDTIRFIAADNTIHTRTITGSVNHPSYSPYYPDLRLYTLDSDLPAAISPCKMMPSNNGSYLVNNTDNRPAALLLDQEEKALIGDWRGGGGYYYPTDADRLIFSEQVISGDSGNPSFLIVNDELVLVTVWTYGGAGSGTPVADFIADINTMIATADTQAGVSTGYTVTEADFSAFPTY